MDSDCQGQGSARDGPRRRVHHLTAWQEGLCTWVATVVPGFIEGQARQA